MVFFSFIISIVIAMGCISGTSSLGYSELSIGSFHVLKQSKLAEGAYGDLWKCQDFSSDTLYALKEIRLQTQELKDMYQKEVRILEKIKTQKLNRSILLKASTVVQHESQSIGCMLLQFGTITLLDELSSKKLGEKEILSILLDISLALEEIHSLGIAHLDVKPQNLILVNGSYKLCDFGSAITEKVDYDRLGKREKNNFNQYLEANSTFSYRSPEMVEPNGQVIEAASDIWMLGCIAYLLTFRKHPFQGEGKLAIISGNIRYPSEGAITSLIKQMFMLDPKVRPSASRLAERIRVLLDKN